MYYGYLSNKVVPRVHFHIKKCSLFLQITHKIITMEKENKATVAKINNVTGNCYTCDIGWTKEQEKSG